MKRASFLILLAISILQLVASHAAPPEHTGWPRPSSVANTSSPLIAYLSHDGTKQVLWAGRHAMIIKREDGTPYPGWPQALPGSPRGPASVADLDGDGIPEVGIISDGDSFSQDTNDFIFLWYADGTPVPGWPKTFSAGNPFAVTDVCPVFADVDGDGFKEVIWCSCATNSGSTVPTTMIHVDRLNGTPLNGWPVILPDEAGRTYSSPAVGDVDGDGKLDIVVSASSGLIYLLHHDSKIFNGWPVNLGGFVVGGAPALADIDHDGELEIFVQSYEGWLSCYKGDGKQMPGWPQRLIGIPWPAAFANLTGDGHLEIVVGDNESIASGGHLNIFRWDGTQLPGWPAGNGGGWFMPPVVADLIGDGQLHIASTDRNGLLRAWDVSGTEVTNLNFPAKTTADTAYSGPVIGDVSGNGNLSVTAHSDDNEHLSIFDLWDLGVPYDRSLAPWPTVLGDNAHQSRYQAQPALVSVSPSAAATNESAQLTIHGDFYLKGMRVLLNQIRQPVISETVTSIVFQLSGGLTPGWYDLTVSNVNSSATTLHSGLAVVGSFDGDDDHDGLPNGWELKYGLDPFDDGSLDPENGPLGDPDHDGTSNWQEWVAGTNPSDSESIFALKGISLSLTDGVMISWSSIAGKRYAVYRSASVSGPFNILTNNLSATPPENTFSDDSSQIGGSWFYRVGIQP